jgi:hypothetical protein
VYYKQSAANDALSTPEIVILQSDGVTPYTSTFAAGDIKLSKGGGAYANIHCTPAHLEDGVWKIPLDATDKDTIGTLILKVKKTGVQTTIVHLGSVVAWDPADGAGLGLTNLNATVSSRATQTSVDTIAGYVDTEVAAIKAKTDQLLFSSAGNLRAAMNEVNSENAAASTTVPKRLTAAGEFKVMDSTGAAIATAASITTLSSDAASGLASLQADTDDIQSKIGTPAGASVSADIATTNGRLTSARAGYLDNLNVGGNVASSAEATAIQNNTRCVRVVPDLIAIPDSSTRTYRIELLLYDEVGNMEAPDSAPTIALVNQAGTDRSSRLDSTTMALVSAGRYRAIYTSTAGDTEEQLVWAFSVAEDGATRIYGNTSEVGVAAAATSGGGGSPGAGIGQYRYIENGSILVFDFFVQKMLVDSTETDPKVGKTGLVEANFTVKAALGGASSFSTIADGSHSIIELGGGFYRLTAGATTSYTDSDGEALVAVYTVTDLSDGAEDGLVWVERYKVGQVPATLPDDADAIGAAALEAIGDAVWSTVLEGSATAGDLVRALVSGMFGKVLSFLSGTLVFKGWIDTAKTRATVTTDSTGRLTSTPGDLT